MANTGVDLQLTYVFAGDPISLVLNGYAGEADFDKSNPIYGKTRDDDRYGASATVYYTNPWGWRFLGSEPMRFFVTGAYVAVDSNIDFYDQEACWVWLEWPSAGSKTTLQAGDACHAVH